MGLRPSLFAGLFGSVFGALALGALVLGTLALGAAVPGFAQAGPPTSGWGAPGLAPGAAAPAQPRAPQSAAAQPSAAPPPPTSGWGAPTAPAAAPGLGAPPGPGTPPGGGGWQGGGGRDCGGEFMPLRADAEKKAGAIKAASAAKDRASICSAFKNFALAEAKVLKFIEDHGAECRIPPEAAKMMRGNHAKTVEIRNKVCDPNAAQPRAPSLSDALGTNRVPTAPQDSAIGKRNGSTFDTLTGNSLNR